MGSACCVAARGKTIVSASGCEVLHYRNVRHYSPTWSFRWENRGRVAGEETSISWLSDGVSRNGGSDVKYESSAFASVDGSPMPDVCGRSPQFPRGLLCVQGLLLQMADIRDEFGNPIQLTDELGNPVKLTDELGNPVHITGVAIPQQAAAAPETGSIEAAVPEKGTDGTLLEALEAEEGRDLHGKDADENNKVIKEEGPDEVPQSTSSSSSSSEEDDGQGGRRRKKKGLKQKIKEKLTGRSSKQREEQHGTEIPTAGATKLSDDQDEKKSVMEKLKDLLPGHHSH